MTPPSRQRSSTPVGFGQGFLNKEHCDNIGASPVPPWPGSIWFLFVPLIEVKRFCNATDIIKNATEKLKSISQNGFQECFQQLYSSWQKCIVAQGSILKYTYLKLLYCLYFSEIKWWQERFEATTCWQISLVTHRHNSASRVAGRMSGLGKYDKWADIMRQTTFVR